MHKFIKRNQPVNITYIYLKINVLRCILTKTDKEALYNNVLYKDKTGFDGLDEKIVEKIDETVLKETIDKIEG